MVDDLLAITIIAIFYTDELQLAVPAAGAAAARRCSRVLVQRRVRSLWLLLPLAAADLGADARVRRARHRGRRAARLHRAGVRGADGRAGPGLAEHFEHLIRPLSAGVAVPVFAFFAAGVTVGGLGGLADALTDTVALGIVAGLVVGKTIGDLRRRPGWSPRFTQAAARRRAALGRRHRAVHARRHRLHRVAADRRAGLRRRAATRDDHVKVGVLVGSLLAAAAGRGRAAAAQPGVPRIYEAEERDVDADGIPDVYETDPDEGRA